MEVLEVGCPARPCSTLPQSWRLVRWEVSVMKWLFDLKRVRGSSFEGGELGVEASSPRITSAEPL
jgi:hypothetical protein